MKRSTKPPGQEGAQELFTWAEIRHPGVVEVFGHATAAEAGGENAETASYLPWSATKRVEFEVQSVEAGQDFARLG